MNLITKEKLKNRKDLIRQLVQEERDRHWDTLSQIVEGNIGLDKESTYYYIFIFPSSKKYNIRGGD